MAKCFNVLPKCRNFAKSGHSDLKSPLALLRVDPSGIGESVQILEMLGRILGQLTGVVLDLVSGNQEEI